MIILFLLDNVKKFPTKFPKFSVEKVALPIHIQLAPLLTYLFQYFLGNEGILHPLDVCVSIDYEGNKNWQQEQGKDEVKDHEKYMRHDWSTTSHLAILLQIFVVGHRKANEVWLKALSSIFDLVDRRLHRGKLHQAKEC